MTTKFEDLLRASRVFDNMSEAERTNLLRMAGASTHANMTDTQRKAALFKALHGSKSEEIKERLREVESRRSRGW